MLLFFSSWACWKVALGRHLGCPFLSANNSKHEIFAAPRETIGSNLLQCCDANSVEPVFRVVSITPFFVKPQETLSSVLQLTSMFSAGMYPTSAVFSTLTSHQYELLSSSSVKASPRTTEAWPSTVAANVWSAYTMSKSMLGSGMLSSEPVSSWSSSCCCWRSSKSSSYSS